jgi:hypothetical protein
MKLPLIDQIAEKLEKTPETPLYNCASVYAWMRDPWPDDPIRPYTPAWTLVVNGQVSPRDLVAAILAIWIEPSIKHPSRYLSWLLQRWSMADHKTEPFLHWERCRALAEMPIGKWFKEGYQEWLEIAPRNNRALPFGLDTLDGYDDEADAMLPESESEDEANLPPPPPPPENEANGLDEHPGSSPFTIREIWFGAQGRLSAQFNGSTYDNWVAGSKLVSYTDGVITIRARHVMAHFWLSERLNPAIEEAVSAVARTPLKIRYVVDPPFSVSPLPG